MNRRSMIGGILGFCGVAVADKSNGSQKQSHLYDWVAGTTTDPSMDPLPYYVDVPRIVCDGIEYDGPIRQVMSGPNGWVTWACKRSDGSVICTDTEVVEETVRGDVTVTSRKCGPCLGPIKRMR